MSWGLQMIGRDRDKMAASVHDRIARSEYKPSEFQVAVANAIQSLVESWPKSDNGPGIKVESNGHVESNGYGTMTISITSISPDSLFD